MLRVDGLNCKQCLHLYARNIEKNFSNVAFLLQTLFAVMRDNLSMSLHATRKANLLALYSTFVTEALKADPSLSTYGLDRSFAAKIQIANTSFSSYKSGARPVGDRIARQIESLLLLSRDWMDVDHAQGAMTSEEAELQAFLKLATRVFKRSTPAARKLISGQLQDSLTRSKEA